MHSRSSGGGVVLWDDGLVAVDVVLPTGHPLLDSDVVKAYRWVGEAVVAALRRLGIEADLVDVEAARASASDSVAQAACFGSLSPWEATVAGRKIVGLSQVRRKEGGIVQVGIPLTANVDLLASLLDGSDADQATALRARMAGVREFRPAVTRYALVEGVTMALEATLGQGVEDTLSPQERDAEARLATDRHSELTAPTAEN